MSDQLSAQTAENELVRQLWAGVLRRLQAGEVLISNEHFVAALEDEYRALQHREPTPELHRQIRHMVTVVNSAHPETYVAQGVHNGVRRAFEQGVRKLGWDLNKIQTRGASTLRRFRRLEGISELLEEANLRPDQIDLLDCMLDVIEAMEGRSPAEKAPGHEPSTPTFSMDFLSSEPPADEKSAAAPQQSAADPHLEEAVRSGEVEREEVAQRSRQQEGRRKEIEKREEAKVPGNLPSYIKQGMLSEDEAEKVRALREVDEKVGRGELDEKEASRIRNSILEGTSRDELERKVRKALDHAVLYLQIFDAMQRIDPHYDDALRFLIDHRQMVTASQASGPEHAEVLKGLLENLPILDALIAIMDRKDQEIRMLSVRLPPYNAIVSRGVEKIGNMTIETSFVDELRTLMADDMSERLNSPEKEVRVRPAADMRCFVSLLDHVIKRTPFRKELRMLRVTQALEDFFRSTSDLREARHQAENFLNRRLRRLFPDLSTDETREIKKRGTQAIDAIEQKILEERRQAVEARRQKGEQNKASSAAGEGGEGDDLELTEEERQKGVLIGRVEVRVAGNMRRIPYKIMPDPEEPSQFIIVQRDPESGELRAQMRRGAKRVVERGKDGTWRPIN